MDILEIISDENNSIREYEKKINMYLNSRKKIDDVDDAVLTVLGDRLIRDGENEKGIILLKNALKRPSYGGYTDGITLFMRLAENEFIHGNVEKGVEYLTHVCENEASNYVEAINFRELTDVWDKYKKYVEGKVRVSAELLEKTGKTPDECVKTIGDILSNLNENDLMADLSYHINEICGDGEELTNLNKWERNFFYVDTLWSEVNSGGFESYLSSYGNYFDRTVKVAQAMGINELVELLEKIKAIFPKEKIPKSTERIEAMILKNELDFDEVDGEFYNKMNQIISEKMMRYVMENKNKFR